MHSSIFVGFGFLMLVATWAPALAISSLLVGEPNENKPLAAMVGKSSARASKQDFAQNAALRVNRAAKELLKRTLALQREENYANRTSETVQYLQAQMSNAKQDLFEAQAVKVGNTGLIEQELQKRELALEREENFVNKTNETLHYLEVRLNGAKIDLMEARVVKSGRAEQELKDRELALEREENYVNRTNETVQYLEEQVKRAKKDLEEARAEKSAKPLAGLVVKSVARAVKADESQNFALRVKNSAQELLERTLALQREQNYANKTDETLHYLEAQMNNARQDLLEAQAVKSGQTGQIEQELKKRELAVKREENFAGKTTKTLEYLEARLNTAKMDLKEARAIKTEFAKRKLNERELALQREENFVNRTSETVHYLEEQVNRAKKHLQEARDEQDAEKS